MVAVLHPLGPGRQIVLDRAVVLIGRSPDCDTVLDVSSKISRIHCALVQVDNSYFIRDLGSMNGVWVDGKRIEKECLLQTGVRVAIGDVPFQFHENVQLASKSVQGQHRPTAVADTSQQYPVFVDERTTTNVPSTSDVMEVVDIIEDVQVIEDVRDIEVVEDVHVIEDVEVVDDASDVEVMPVRPLRTRPIVPKRSFYPPPSRNRNAGNDVVETPPGRRMTGPSKPAEPRKKEADDRVPPTLPPVIRPTVIGDDEVLDVVDVNRMSDAKAPDSEIRESEIGGDVEVQNVEEIETREPPPFSPRPRRRRRR